MKIYVKLYEHTEYKGWSVYGGIFKSFNQAISQEVKDWKVYLKKEHLDDELKIYKHTTEYQDEKLTFVIVIRKSVFDVTDEYYAKLIEEYLDGCGNFDGKDFCPFVIKEEEF